MSINVENINNNNFRNICRTCTLPCDIKFPPDNVILNVFYKLTDIHFETNVELPQQVCLKCFQKINEIQEFALECKKAQITLSKCFDDLENEDQDVKEYFDPLEQNQLEMEIKEEITIVEHKIEFNDVEFNDVKDELKIYETNLGNTNNELKENDENTNCSEDNSISNNSNVDAEHEEKSNSKGKCDVCNKYNCLTSFEMHKSLQDDDRPFKCDQCSKAFALPYQLKRHMRTHTGERPFQCDQCSKSFSLKEQLKRHMVRHSGHRPHKCDQCSKTYTRADSLKKHLLTHSRERP